MRNSLLYLLLSFYSVNAYKILIYASPMGYSHSTFWARIADVLHEGGHNVTVFQPVWPLRPWWVTPTLAKKVLYPLPERIVPHVGPWDSNFWKMNCRSFSDQLQLFTDQNELQLRVCDLLLGDNDTLQMLANEHYDAGMTEMIAPCGFPIFDRIGINHYIPVTASGLIDTIGDIFDVPKLPSIVPSYLLPYSGRMSFVERTINFVAIALSNFYSSQFRGAYKEVWARYNLETDDEYYKSKGNYLLSNSDEFLEVARPTSLKVVHIGGIAPLQRVPPLSEKLQQVVEKAELGVVYISFGSVISTKKMPKNFREGIIEVAKMFKGYDFIWKVDEGDVIQGVPNLHTFSWVAQAALIAHPNLRCFVSHAGINSILELTRIGKPSILVPIFLDQLRNAYLVAAKNTTIVIEKEEFDRDTLAAALQRVLSDNGFAQRAERLASLMVNKPFSAKDRLLSTVEFSIRHGRIHDLDIGWHLNAIQYYSVDVMAFLTILLVFIVILWLYTCRFFCRRILWRKIKSD